MESVVYSGWMTKTGSLDFFQKELRNFEDIARHIKPGPGDIPSVSNIDIFGDTIPLNGVIGGDHIIYVDFTKRFDLERRLAYARETNRSAVVENLELNRHRGGILIADVAGHQITDYLLAAMLHQAFLLGVRYELTLYGEITADLFENINIRFFNSSSISKFITMIYGEIFEDGRFRFINAGHPPPQVFSHKYDRLVEVCTDCTVHFPPIGTMPSRDDVDYRKNPSQLGYKKKYQVSELSLMGSGDILLLYTDGVYDHIDEGEVLYFPDRLEKTLRRAKNATAQEIFNQIKTDLKNFSPLKDDASLVVIKNSG